VVYGQVFRELILPELRKEVNEGRNFATVRQVYDAMVLATWFKRHLKDGLLGSMYVGQNKTAGVDLADKTVKEKIFEQYLMAFKKKAYDYIKEDYDPQTARPVLRKYVSGGFDFTTFGQASSRVYSEKTSPQGLRLGKDMAMASINISPMNAKGSVIHFPDPRTYTNDHVFKQLSRPDSAMMEQLRSKARKLVVPVMLAAGGLMFNAGHVQGATFSYAEDQTLQVRFSRNDTLGGVYEKLRMAFKKIAPEEYANSSLKGNMWRDVIPKLSPGVNLVKADQTINIPQYVPQEVVNKLNKNKATLK
jgi:hypothetical protein